ncbi:MAG TPA: hypothetical protein VHE81_06475 [Lacipirellulaceae bacterium]|nr:hypothetical protein [Lacipirellulaceae bacterium]
MRIANGFAILLATLLAGCADMPTPTTGLVKPPARCMRTRAIPKPKLGEESTAYSARLINHSKSEASKDACLKRWVRTITK